ncbi:hypothetical protein QQG55_31265 [Brugia pahangi]
MLLYQVSNGFASSARAKTPAASGAAADVPLCDRVQRLYRSVVATPVSGFRPPFENVEANVEEQLLQVILQEYLQYLLYN